MPENPNFSDRIPERRQQLDDVRGHEATRHAHQRHGGPSQIRVRQRLAVVSFADTLRRLRQMNTTSVQMIRAEGGVARREVDLHCSSLGVAAASGWSAQSSSAQASSVRDGDALRWPHAMGT